MMHLPRGFVAAIDDIDRKQRDEPDINARDWSFVDEEEAEMYGDVFHIDGEV